MDSELIAFTLAAAALTIAPGPDTMLVIRNVLRGGRRDGIVTTFGICGGLFVHAALSALGVSMLLMHSAAAFQLLKLAGAGYLVWLGLQSLRRALSLPPVLDGLEASAPSHRRSPRHCFLEGWLSNVLNPRMLFTNGQVGTKLDGTTPKTTAEQAEIVFSRIEAVLAAAKMNHDAR